MGHSFSDQKQPLHLPPQGVAWKLLQPNGKVYTEAQIQILKTELKEKGHYSKEKIKQILDLKEDEASHVYAVEKTDRGLYFKTSKIKEKEEGKAIYGNLKNLQFEDGSWHIGKMFNEQIELKGGSTIWDKVINALNALRASSPPKADDLIIRTSKKTSKQKYYIIMQREEGENLLEILNKEKMLKQQSLWYVNLYRVLCALKAILLFHTLGYVHRDIKLENIILSMMAEDDSINAYTGGALIDYDDVILYQSKEFNLVGTPGYAPYEASTQKSDVYTTSLLILDILSNKTFRKTNNFTESLHEMPAELKELTPLIKDMHQSNPHERPTIKEVYNQLNDFFQKKVTKTQKDEIKKIKTQARAEKNKLLEKFKKFLRKKTGILEETPEELISPATKQEPPAEVKTNTLSQETIQKAIQEYRGGKNLSRCQSFRYFMRYTFITSNQTKQILQDLTSEQKQTRSEMNYEKATAYIKDNPKRSFANILKKHMVTS